MKIEFLYFKDCPSWKPAFQFLKEVLGEENIEIELELVNVDSLKKAKQVNFQGSPSIKINGEDWEGKNDPFSYQCRVYNIDGKLTGVPTKEFIMQHLKRYKR